MALISLLKNCLMKKNKTTKIDKVTIIANRNLMPLDESISQI